MLTAPSKPSLMAAKSSPAPSKPSPAKIAAKPSPHKLNFLRAVGGPTQRRKIVRRDYFKGDERYRETIAAAVTTIAGGGQIPKRDQAKFKKTMENSMHAFKDEEEKFYRFDREPAGSDTAQVNNDKFLKLKKAQEKYWDFGKTKNLNDVLMRGLAKATFGSGKKKKTFDLDPAHESLYNSLADTAYEFQWC